MHPLTPPPRKGKKSLFFFFESFLKEGGGVRKKSANTHFFRLTASLNVASKLFWKALERRTFSQYSIVHWAGKVNIKFVATENAFLHGAKQNFILYFWKKHFPILIIFNYLLDSLENLLLSYQISLSFIYR